MNHDDIIRMAREAGLEVHPRKEQVRVGVDALLGIDSTEKVKRFAALVAAAEREACAKICEDVHAGKYNAPEFWREGVAYTCAAAIRARGQA